VVAAAGTGAQEVMTLLDRWGIGVSQVIGVGGRDLSAGVGGLMARDAVRALDADPGTEVILLVSKPPAEEVARTVIGASRDTPVVAACLGMSAPDGRLAGADLAATLEGGALRVAEILGRPAPDLGASRADEAAIARVGTGRTAVRGFFTGGTLCYEAQVILSQALGPVYSNIPLHPDLGLPAPPGAHICLDLGEEEYTKGRPHPMIDPAARREILAEQAFGADIAAVLLDVVLGYGSHPDPAGEIAGTCADIVAAGAAVVCYVLGAHGDRQGLGRQRATLAAGLGPLAAEFPILHTQDCISARAACRVRDAAAGPPPVVVRTVHHVDDFTSPSLINCQRQAILEPDRILVVSERWQQILADEYRTSAEVVHNGVDFTRFRSADPDLAAALRQRAGAADRPLILAVGGIEPRKGSDTLMAAIAALSRSAGRAGRRPVLAVVGGHSFQDYREYRDRVLSSLPGLGLRLDDDVVLLGTVPDDELPGWYAAADVLAFPSTKEGFGLAVLEAMSAGLPVVASDLPVFREYLRPGQDAVMVPVDDAAALAAALGTVLDDAVLAGRLRAAGREVCARFTWARCAAEHQRIYADLKWR